MLRPSGGSVLKPLVLQKKSGWDQQMVKDQTGHLRIKHNSSVRSLSPVRSPSPVKWRRLSFKNAPELIGKKIKLLYEQQAGHGDNDGEDSTIKGYSGYDESIYLQPDEDHDQLSIIEGFDKNVEPSWNLYLDGKFYTSGSGNDWVKFKLV